MDTKGQQYCTLLAGRWFRTKSFEGALRATARDFTRISLESPTKSHVLASIPGTEQAKEAVIANQIPQTASVNRKEAKLKIRYTGPPHPVTSERLSPTVQ
jgi:hypothetical protein